MKKQNGITLIALIITILLLLLVAAVIMGEIKDSKMIEHAQSASDSYVVEQEKERIALAYSEYQIEKILDPTKTLQITGEDATTEPVGEYGWKVTYEDTENVYGVNTKGEYDETVTMVIKAVDEVSEIFDEFKTTNPELDIDGISLDDFIIYEDKKAISDNAANNTEIPEKYIFYNWNKLTTDEIRVIETQYEPTPATNKRIENASNRLFILDINGDGYVNEIDYDMIRIVSSIGEINTTTYLENTELYPMEQSKNNYITDICITGTDEETGDIITIYDQMASSMNEDYDGVFNPELDFYMEARNVLMKFHNDGLEYRFYIRAVHGADRTKYQAYNIQLDVFYMLYDKHIYYKSARPSSI